MPSIDVQTTGPFDGTDLEKRPVFAPKTTRPASRALARVLLVILLVAGCSPTSAGAPGASDTAAATRAPQPLECVVNAYPCSNAAVDRVVFDRSRELARQAADHLAAGASFDAAAAFIAEAPGIAEIASDLDSIRFRLEGGRPTWVLPRSAGGEATNSEPGPFLDSPIGGSGMKATLASWSDATPSEPGAPEQVVGTNHDTKKAIVLAPYAFNSSDDVTDSIAGILRRTRGYENGVTYLANETAEATDVSTNTFAHLAGNDVIYIDTPSGIICRGEPEECYGVLAAQDLFGSEESRTAQTQGLDLIVWVEGGEGVGLSGGFFRTYYPNGIENALIFLGGPDIDDASLIENIVGASSEIYWWDGKRDAQAAAEAMTSYIARLAETGRATSRVYNEMQSQLTIGEARWHGGTPKWSKAKAMRIREVVTILDPTTGKPLERGGTIEIDGEVDDGLPDLVPFLVQVDGLSEGEEDHTTINVTIDDASDAYLPSNDAEMVATHTWQVGASFQHVDLHDGQTLTIDAVAQLEEGGISRQTLTFNVTGAKKEPAEASGTPASGALTRVEIGRVYEGTASTITPLGYGSAAVTKAVTVRLVRDPKDEPGSKNVSFRVESGYMNWSLGGGDNDCKFSASAARVSIPASTFDSLTIKVPDAPNQPYTYSGLGEFEGGRSETVYMNCKLVDVEFEADADGTWFYAPRDKAFATDGATIKGAHGKYTWSFRKVE